MSDNFSKAIAVGLNRPYRVLCLDGGGMRGIYSAAYLHKLSEAFKQKLGVGEDLDIGSAFDLIVGTSTGAIIAVGLAAGVQPSTILKLYREHGEKIFPVKTPTGVVSAVQQLFTREDHLRKGDHALEVALKSVFGCATLGELYHDRDIALSIPAVQMSRQRAWIFKTAHLPDSFRRDDNYSLVDICKATSAAPIFRSLAAIDNSDATGYEVFADGGLYANSPIMVGLIDALQVAHEDQEIEIFSLGTCKKPEGQQIPRSKLHRGLKEWKFGAEAASLAIDVQDEFQSEIARLLCPHLKHWVKLISFPRTESTVHTMQYLDLDETSDNAAEALISQAGADINETISKCNDPLDDIGVRIHTLFESMKHPVVPMKFRTEESS